MSSAGHVLDMIKRMKANRSMLHSKLDKFKIGSRESIHPESVDENKRLEFKTVSEQELAESRVKMRIQSRKEKKRFRMMLMVFIVFFVAILIFAINYVFFQYPLER